MDGYWHLRMGTRTMIGLSKGWSKMYDRMVAELRIPLCRCQPGIRWFKVITNLPFSVSISCVL